MQILELNLKHFGKFLEHKVLLVPGMNIIYGGNETGKTTIHAFIRAMFFGLEKTRGRAGKNEYLLRQPWDNPAYFAGFMRLEYQGKVFRIERNFFKNEKSVRLVCEDSGQEQSSEPEELQQLLAGMNENIFVNTIFIPQAGCETGEALAEELRKFMVNFQETQDGSLDVSETLNKLKNQRKVIETRKKQEQDLLDEKISRKELEAGYVKQDMERLQGKPELFSGVQAGQGSAAGAAPLEESESHQLKLPLERMRNEARRDEDAEEENQGTFWRFLLLLDLLLGAGGIIGLLCGIFAADWGSRILFFLIGIVLCTGCWKAACYTINWKKESMWHPHKTAAESEEVPAGREALFHSVKESGLSDEASYTTATRQEIQEEQKSFWKREQKHAELQEKNIRYTQLRKETEELYGAREKLCAYDRQLEAVDLAMMRIRELSAGIYRESGENLNKMASEILAGITEGRYTQIALDEKMEVRVNTPTRLLYLHQVSFGTMNQIYFALRMAAGALLSNYANLPLILDETFAMFDDERLREALRWLNASGRQVILFTCQKREKELFCQINESQRRK
ncbi:MAG: AAA family ATPase [Lachnospiraceae bacterium]|nr:AAA family ATPase [Lachnospiraceae bacterium]